MLSLKIRNDNNSTYSDALTFFSVNDEGVDIESYMSDGLPA